MGIIGLVRVALTLVFALSASAQAQTVQSQPGGVGAAAAPVAAAAPDVQRPTRVGEPTEVRVSLYVIDVDGVDSAEQNFSASVFLEARWTDPLLKHDGLGPKVLQTTAIWTPRLAIVNQQQAWSAFPSFVEVSPEGEVVYRQKTWGWFSQPLDLRDFPKDRQVLTVHVVAAGLLQTDVTMLPLIRANGRHSGVADTFSMPDFKVVSWRAEPRAYFPFQSEAGTAGFIMEIDVERFPGYYFWKLIVPLCLIIAMSWAPRWLAPDETGTSIGIAATSLLTLVAYLFASTVMLPRVSYFTRMDEFILLATLMVFISLLQTVITSAFITPAREAKIRRINMWSRGIYPLLLLAVLAASFAR